MDFVSQAQKKIEIKSYLILFNFTTKQFLCQNHYFFATLISCSNKNEKKMDFKI